MCVCVCVCTAASSKGKAAILPGTGREWRPTWLQAASNYPESHFNEVLPNALNHSIFRGTRLSAAALELGGEQASDPSPRTPFGFSIWLVATEALDSCRHVERHQGGAEGTLLSLLCFRPKAVCRDAIPLGFPDVVKRLAVVLLGTNPAAVLS